MNRFSTNNVFCVQINTNFKGIFMQKDNNSRQEDKTDHKRKQKK